MPTAAANAAKHGVTFEEAVTVFLDLDYLLISERPILAGSWRWASPDTHVSCLSCIASGASGLESSAPVPLRAGSERLMSEDKNPIEPSAESLEEIPPQDFSRAIRPNRYARLRGAFQHAVSVDRKVWEHLEAKSAPSKHCACLSLSRTSDRLEPVEHRTTHPFTG